MAENIILYYFCKERNSFKTPATGGTTFSCVFDEPFSVLYPRVRLSITSTQAGNFKYAYIETFNRFYFVDSWTYQDGLYHGQLSVDPLASHRTAVLSSSQYVLRTADNNATATNRIVDNMIPITTRLDTVNTRVNNWFSYSSVADGCYIVGIINSDLNAVGAVSYYAMTAGNFNALKYYLMHNIEWAGIADSEITSALQKALINPIQYIASVIWLPLTQSDCGGTDVTSVNIGYWTVPNISAKRLRTSGTAVKTFSITRTFHPDKTTAGAWLDTMPYTEIELHLPPFGNIVLDPLRFPLDSIGVDITVDLISGKALMELYSVNTSETPQERVFVESHSAVMGVNIEIAQTTVNMGDNINTTVNTVLSAIPVAISTAVTDFFKGTPNNEPIASHVGSMLFPQQVQSSGGNGGFCDYFSSRYLITRFRRVGGIALARNGKPLCKYVTLNTLAGYTLCGNAHFDSPACFSAEIESISSYLNSGVIIE